MLFFVSKNWLESYRAKKKILELILSNTKVAINLIFVILGLSNQEKLVIAHINALSNVM